MRTSFGISIVAALCAATLGALVGLAAGSAGRRLDAVAMRLIDVLSSQNHFLFGILILVLSRPLVGPAGAIFLSVGVTHWTSVTRIVRGEVLSLREQKFVAASVNAGAGRRRLARRHFLPHVFPATALGFVLLVPHAISTRPIIPSSASACRRSRRRWATCWPTARPRCCPADGGPACSPVW
ncbi:MAG: ABC transporter permease subunit [Pseudonocardiaceae bacterium]